jgi:Domain of unknown function (DUF4136)
MRLPRIIPVFVLILFAASSAFAKVRTDYDHSVDFSKYKTFMWLGRPEANTPFIETRIVDAVNSQLQMKGLVPVNKGADLGVRTTISTEERQTVNTYYDGGWGPGWGHNWGWGWGWGWGSPGSVSTWVDTDLIATTTVDLIDMATEKTVWRGTSVGEISDKPDKAWKKTAKRIDEMFEEFPFLRGRISD